MNSKTHDALLLLARDLDDRSAMITVCEENREAIRAAFRRWIAGSKHRNCVEVGVMVRVCRAAHLFDPKKHRAEAWVFNGANIPRACRTNKMDLPRGLPHLRLRFRLRKVTRRKLA
jgi:hypothetical protein